MSKTRSAVKRSHDPAIRQAAEGFALIAAVLREDATQAGASVGLSGAQARTLALLAQAPLGMRLSEIAERLGVTPASASDTVAGLVRRRFAARGKDPQDGRAVRFTARSGVSNDESEAHRGADLQESIGDLPISDRTALQQILVRLILSLQRRGRIHVARACVNCRFFRPGAHVRKALPHHCDYVDKPFADAALRVACLEFEAADADKAAANQARWLRGARASLKQAPVSP